MATDADVANAARFLINEFTSTRAWESGANLTCGEVDALAHLHLAAGDRVGAAGWLESHTEDEDPNTTVTADLHRHLADEQGHLIDEAVNQYLSKL